MTSTVLGKCFDDTKSDRGRLRDDLMWMATFLTGLCCVFVAAFSIMIFIILGAVHESCLWLWRQIPTSQSLAPEDYLGYPFD